MRDYTLSDEAKAKRRERIALRRCQADDPLRERARLVAFWRKCAETNRHYAPHHGAWWAVFMYHPAWRWTVMPRLRQRIDERERAHNAAYAAELRESARRFAVVKAAAAKARATAPQRDMLDEARAC